MDPHHPLETKPKPSHTFGASCPLCSNDRCCARQAEIDGYTLYTCPNCTLSFSWPLSAGDKIYYETHFSPDFYWRWEFSRFLADRPNAGGSLLELGCHTGHFLNRAREAGYQVTGVDINERALRFVREHYGVPRTHVANFQDLKALKDIGPFDVVVAFQVIEHLEDPVDFLRGIGSLLKPGGTLAVAVPNDGRWTIRYGRETWDYPPHHLTRWTGRALRTALEKAGWEILSLAEQPTDTIPTARAFLENRLLRAASVGALTRLKEVAAPDSAVASETSHGHPSRFRAKTVDALRKAKGGLIRSAVSIGAPIALPYVKSLRLVGENLYALSSRTGG